MSDSKTAELFYEHHIPYTQTLLKNVTFIRLGLSGGKIGGQAVVNRAF